MSERITVPQVIDQIKTVYDPEIPVNIYDLGLIYEIEIDSGNNILVKMTLTTPACPVAGSLPGEVEQKIREIHNAKSARVELVWDPPWNQTMMTEEAQFELGLM